MFIEYVLIPVFLGMLAFFALHLVSNPILEFFRLRKEIQIDLIDMSNIWCTDHPHDENRARTSSEKIRRLSAQMQALDHSINFPRPHIPYWVLCRILGMDIKNAAGNLMIYHNDFMDGSGLRTKARHEIQKALKLPLTDTPEKVSAAIKMAENRMNKVG